MMRSLLSILLTALLGFLLAQFTPWYSIAIAGILVSFILPTRSATQAFFVGFVGGILLWGGMSGYLDIQNEHLLSTRMGQMFGGLSAMMMVAVTAILGGLYAGLGGMVGYFGRALVFNDNSK